MKARAKVIVYVYERDKEREREGRVGCERQRWVEGERESNFKTVLRYKLY